MGPIEGAQPNSQAWVDGFDHQGEVNPFLFFFLLHQKFDPDCVDPLTDCFFVLPC